VVTCHQCGTLAPFGFRDSRRCASTRARLFTCNSRYASTSGSELMFSTSDSNSLTIRLQPIGPHVRDSSPLAAIGSILLNACATIPHRLTRRYSPGLQPLTIPTKRSLRRADRDGSAEIAQTGLALIPPIIVLNQTLQLARH
jgi:hypothetical protein